MLYTLIGANSFTEYGYDVAGLGDLDGDGLGEIVVGTPLDSVSLHESGSVEVRRGHSFFLSAEPKRVANATPFSLRAGQGVPGGLVLIQLVSFNDVPFGRIGWMGPLSSSGVLHLTGLQHPANVQSMELIAVTVDAGGRLQSSVPERVSFY